MLNPEIENAMQVYRERQDMIKELKTLIEELEAECEVIRGAALTCFQHQMQNLYQSMLETAENGDAA